MQDRDKLEEELRTHFFGHQPSNEELAWVARYVALADEAFGGSQQSLERPGNSAKTGS